MQEITITLRVDFDSANKKIKEPLMLDIARKNAKELITNAMMICDSRKPQISVTCGDFFSTNEDVQLFNPDDDASAF